MIKIDNKKIDPYSICQIYDKKVVFQYNNGLYFYENDKIFEIVSKHLYAVVENYVDKFYNKNLYYVCLHESNLLFNIYDLESKTNNLLCKLDLNILKENDIFPDIEFRYIINNYLLLILDSFYYKILDLKSGQLLELSEVNKLNIHSIDISVYKNNINLIVRQRNQAVDFDTLCLYNPAEELDEDYNVDIKSMSKIAIIDFNKFISGKSNYTNVILQDKWFEETSIINSNLNSQQFYLLTKNCLDRTRKISICSFINNSFIKNQEFILKDTYFDMNIFEYKNKIYSGPHRPFILEKPTDFNFRVENILDDKDCFNINFKNVSNIWVYYFIESDKLFISYTDNKRPITNCIYNRLDNSIEYLKGTILPVPFGSRELVFVKE